MNFREMTQGDINSVFKVRISTRENRVTMQRLEDLGITPESVLQSLQNNTRGWVCEEVDKILGFTLGDGSSGEMLVLAVLPEAEGLGIGRQLMNLVQEWLFSQGHHELWLLENPDPAIRAYHFYRSLGWVPTGEYRNEEQVLKLRKNIRKTEA